LIKIVKQTGDTVEFIVNQLFLDGQAQNSVNMLAVNYRDGVGSQDCDFKTDVAAGPTEKYTAICFEGVTDVAVFVAVGDNFDVEECESCKAPSAELTDTVAYYFKLSCEPICEPTSSPVTPSPVIQSGGGTPAPATPGPQPNLDCYTGPIVEAQEGTCPLEMGKEPVNVSVMNDSTVTFTVSNFWGGQVTHMSIRYPTAGGLTCNGAFNVNHNSVMKEESFTATCLNGIAEIEVNVHETGFGSGANAGIDSSCNSPGNGCVYHYVLPCKQELLCPKGAQPDPTPAPQGELVFPPIDPGPLDGCVRQDSCSHISITEMQGADVVNCGSSYPADTCQYKVCITLDASSEGCGGKPGGPGDSISHYCKTAVDNNTNKNDQTSCATLDSWGSSYNDYDATESFVSCMYVGGNQKVEFLMKDGESCSDSVSAFGVDGGTASCAPTTKTGEACSGNAAGKECIWTITTPECSGSRRMDDLSDKEAFTTDDKFAGVSEPSENDEDVPYCVSVDFPCEGEEDDMVHVCHYSARKGYQTFCIPESDSDILRFYPNDYCGPCEGGYGGIAS